MKKTANIYIKVGRRVIALRKAAHLTQERLAIKAGVDRAYIGRIERGEKRASLEILDKIAEALGVALFELLTLV